MTIKKKAVIECNACRTTEGRLERPPFDSHYFNERDVHLCDKCVQIMKDMHTAWFDESA